MLYLAIPSVSFKFLLLGLCTCHLLCWKVISPAGCLCKAYLFILSHFLCEVWGSQHNPRRPFFLPHVTLSLMDPSASRDSHLQCISFIRLFPLTGHFLKDRTEANNPVSLYLPRAPNPVPWSQYIWFRFFQQEWNFIKFCHLKCSSVNLLRSN